MTQPLCLCSHYSQFSVAKAPRAKLSFLISLLLLIHFHDFRRASHDASSALDTVRMQVSAFIATRFVRSKLHRANLGTSLAHHLTSRRHTYPRETSLLLLRSDPSRERTHRTERTPRTGCIDKSENYPDDGSDHNQVPECASDARQGQSVGVKFTPNMAKMKQSMKMRNPLLRTNFGIGL